MPRPIQALIDSGAMAHNLATVRHLLEQDAPGRSPFVWAVIKARAYGHGLQAGLQGFAKADGLAMLDLEEAVQCREAGWNGPILLLEGFFAPQDLSIVDRYRLALTIHCQEQLDMLQKVQPQYPIPAFVKLNSGMHRLGFQPHEYRQAFARAMELHGLGVLDEPGKMTHFARADDDPDFTREQLACFDQVTQGLPGAISLCNSAATLTAGFAAAIPGTPQWVRPGICLYGASPFADRSAASFGLRPAMTLQAELINTHVLSAGQGIGYGHTFRAPHDMPVGIVACGYADGYPRHAVSGTPVVVDGVRTRLLGRVSMDMLAIDLGPAPQATVGSRVVLWGAGGPSVDEVAQSCGTIGYELLTAITSRVPRQYL